LLSKAGATPPTSSKTPSQRASGLAAMSTRPTESPLKLRLQKLQALLRVRQEAPPRLRRRLAVGVGQQQRHPEWPWELQYRPDSFLGSGMYGDRLCYGYFISQYLWAPPPASL